MEGMKLENGKASTDCIRAALIHVSRGVSVFGGHIVCWNKYDEIPPRFLSSIDSSVLGFTLILQSLRFFNSFVLSID